MMVSVLPAYFNPIFKYSAVTAHICYSAQPLNLEGVQDRDMFTS